MALQFLTSYVEDSVALFAHYKGLAERAMAQVDDAALTATLDAENNSIAVQIQHMAGNQLSRWTDFLTSDGEKRWRNRDGEFEPLLTTRTEIMQQWERGWACLFHALEGLTEADLSRPVMIRGERHSVMQAINRQVAHLGYHVGQIVMLAKHFAGADWKAITIPRGGSAMFSAQVTAGEKSQR